MGKVPVDRGSPLEGINKTIKDNRVPYNLLRDSENVDFPAGRTKRRKGMSVFTERSFDQPQLMRHRPSTLDQDRVTNGKARSDSYRTPTSYALLPWQEKYQLRATVDWTMEFFLTLGEVEELVTSPHSRETINLINNQRIQQRLKQGVFVYDQTVLVSDTAIRTNEGLIWETNRATGLVETFGISTLAIGFNADEIFAYCNLYDDINQVYDLGVGVLSGGITYQAGDVYRVSVQYEQEKRELTLWLNGVKVDELTLPANYLFAGEGDYINKRNLPLERDIVLLNEHTVRSGYSSTCVMKSENGNEHSAFPIYESYYSEQPNVWCCSPPRGTGMSDLRFWPKAVKIDPVRAFTFLDPVVEGMVSYFPLTEQGPVCFDQLDRNNRITLHNSYGGYISDDGILNNTGLSLRDNQFIVKSVDGTNPDIEPVAGALADLFNHEFTDKSGRKSFTVQIQFRTETRRQRELTLVQTPPALMEGSPQSDSRQAVDAPENALISGALNLEFLANYEGTVGGVFGRAFDQTLWTVEGKQIQSETDSVNFNDRQRITLARGAITPDNLLVFEFVGSTYDGVPVGRYFRMVGTTVLDDSTVYTVTFIKRPLQVIPASPVDPLIYGYKLEMYLNGALEAEMTIGDNTVAGAPKSDIDVENLIMCPVEHAGIQDVIIGASAVNDPFDRSISAPEDLGTPRRYPTAQRRLSPRQDMTFSGVIGFFRLWSVALAPSEVARTFNSALDLSSFSSTVMNMELSGIPGREIPDQGPFSFRWDLGYKTWGAPHFEVVTGEPIYAYRGGWRNRDVLGWGPLNITQPLQNDEGPDEYPCRGLAYYAATLTRQNGLIGNWGGFFNYDRNVSGNPGILYASPGLVNTYDPGHRWRGTVIADRTVLTSYSGRPMVFNGTDLTPLGFDYTDVGRFYLGIQGGGSLTPDKWFGIRICYFSEKDNIFDISGMEVMRATLSNGTLVIRDIPKHPDPRISNIVIGMTQPQELKSLAEVAPVFFQESGWLPNQDIDVLNIAEDVDALRGEIPSLDTPAPFCAFSASYNDRLWLAGDPNEPDVLHYSDQGNIQRWNTTTNRIILDRGAGDRIVGLSTAFGSLFVFKPNSIWRVVEGGPGNPAQRVQVTSIGPSNEDAFALITIPDTGKTAFIMWTTHGPYIYDEVNLQSLAFPVEGEEDPFDFLDKESVFVSHDVVRRTIHFHYRSLTNGEPSKEYDGVLAYNYRYQTWGRYTGIPGKIALSVDLTRNTQGGGETISQFTEDYFSILGGLNGRTYQFDSSVQRDAIPLALGENVLPIQSYTNGRINLIPMDASGSFIQWPLRALCERWVTIFNPSLTEWQSFPILYNGADFLLIDLDYAELSFEPSSGDYVYIGQPPGHLEFPWDELEVPYIEKQVHRISLWATGRFYLRFSRNYNPDAFTDPVWNQLVTDLPKRIDLDDPVPNSAAIKLFVLALDESFTLDSMMYMVDYKDHPAETD